MVQWHICDPSSVRLAVEEERANEPLNCSVIVAMLGARMLSPGTFAREAPLEESTLAREIAPYFLVFHVHACMSFGDHGICMVLICHGCMAVLRLECELEKWLQGLDCMSNSGAESAQCSDSSPSSGSLVSRHVFSLQRQVAALQESTVFADDRITNLETISTSHSRDLDKLEQLPALVPSLLDRVAHLEDIQVRQAAKLETQGIAIARLSRRIQELETQANQ